MNTEQAKDASGALALYPGRFYRMLFVVNGETTLEDLGDQIIAEGFDPRTFAATAPGHWKADRPRDWPDERVIDLSVNECLVRASGRFVGPEPVALSGDARIGQSHAVFSLAQLWDYVPSLGHEVAAGAITPATPTAPKDHRGAAVLLTAGALLGLGIWQSRRAEERIERETARMRAAIERDQALARASRLAELVREGRSREEAAAIVDEEASDDCALVDLDEVG